MPRWPATPNSPFPRTCRCTSPTLTHRGSDPSHENTNGLIREYLSKGIELTSRQPYPDSIADGLNRPRAVLGFLTPREVFTKLLNEDLSKTA